MITMSQSYLYEHWIKAKTIRLRSKSYRVGKMSYGDYFLEPGKEGRETDAFNLGTLWPTKVIISGQINYQV